MKTWKWMLRKLGINEENFCKVFRALEESEQAEIATRLLFFRLPITSIDNARMILNIRALPDEPDQNPAVAERIQAANEFWLTASSAQLQRVGEITDPEERRQAAREAYENRCLETSNSAIVLYCDTIRWRKNDLLALYGDEMKLFHLLGEWSIPIFDALLPETNPSKFSWTLPELRELWSCLPTSMTDRFSEALECVLSKLDPERLRKEEILWVIEVLHSHSCKRLEFIEWLVQRSGTLEELQEFKTMAPNDLYRKRHDELAVLELLVLIFMDELRLLLNNCPEEERTPKRVQELLAEMKEKGCPVPTEALMIVSAYCSFLDAGTPIKVNYIKYISFFMPMITSREKLMALVGNLGFKVSVDIEKMLYEKMQSFELCYADRAKLALVCDPDGALSSALLKEASGNIGKIEVLELTWNKDPRLLTLRAEFLVSAGKIDDLMDLIVFLSSRPINTFREVFDIFLRTADVKQMVYLWNYLNKDTSIGSKSIRIMIENAIADKC